MQTPLERAWRARAAEVCVHGHPMPKCLLDMSVATERRRRRRGRAYVHITADSRRPFGRSVCAECQRGWAARYEASHPEVVAAERIRARLRGRERRRAAGAVPQFRLVAGGPCRSGRHAVSDADVTFGKCMACQMLAKARYRQRRRASVREANARYRASAAGRARDRRRAAKRRMLRAEWAALGGDLHGWGSAWAYVESIG